MSELLPPCIVPRYLVYGPHFVVFKTAWVIPGPCISLYIVEPIFKSLTLSRVICALSELREMALLESACSASTGTIITATDSHWHEVTRYICGLPYVATYCVGLCNFWGQSLRSKVLRLFACLKNKQTNKQTYLFKMNDFLKYLYISVY
jgi:hypothetical protein